MAGSHSHKNHTIRREVQLLNSRSAKLWQCCNCLDGWFSTKLNSACPTCHNYRCDQCKYAAS
ncbi:hypothetical protein BGZ61DRAFT_591220 [Ilyonectria robusta]|uniref:uncharacterized protein n=1 Tax=Ilyonectria robusta TaxID=1079257 RepID=UPI001E8CE572|nr:uncharacterized protein BGZ61DRAFT_591220 [Ilyonectria robusta]KAH6973378.1 hypothetical protein BKA56DRAFT_676087 [Ilyonectria sp. MPI-CAGE-AT-0026]KAH8677246.1 hypothetical protein BGZ61DRAFT_591220 [Ilyonectria robusta]